jgi:hypothetical protein
VLAHDLRRGRAVPPFDGVDQFRVLLPGLLPPAAGDRRVVPAHPAVDLGHEVEEDLVAGQLADAPVQLRVGQHHGVDVVGGERRVTLLAQLAQAGDPRDVGVLGGQPGGFRLQQRPDGQQLVDLGGSRPVDEGPVPGTEVHPSVGAQHLQRLADRLAGDAEHLRELALHEMLAGRELPRDDQFLHGLADALTQRARAVDPVRGHAFRQLAR